MTHAPDHDPSTCPCCQRLKWIKEAPRRKLEEALIDAEDSAAFHKGKRLELEAERERLMRAVAAARSWRRAAALQGSVFVGNEEAEVVKLDAAIASLDAGGKEG